MYLRAAHAELNIRALRQFIKENPLGIVVTSIPSADFHSLQCTHIPWVLDVEDGDSETELGKLRGHLARANPHSKAMIEAVQQLQSSNGPLEEEVTVIFNGPVQSYVTPKFYTSTKPDTGKVVPTWNYSAVQAYGKAFVYYDSKNTATDAFLDTIVRDLTQISEKSTLPHAEGEEPKVWEVDDAPAPYIEIMKKNIIGIEIKITTLEGKFKMSQELVKGDREGVIDGFASLGTEAGIQMARTVEERGALKDAKAAAAKP